MRKNEKRKEVLKKAGYFAAGVAATVGIMYLTKRLFEDTLNPKSNMSVKTNKKENLISIEETIKMPSIFKGAFTDRDTCLTPANAKIVGTAIVACADELLDKKE